MLIPFKLYGMVRPDGHVEHCDCSYCFSYDLHKPVRMERYGRNIAFALAIVAVRFASEKCCDADEILHWCGHSFACSKARHVLDRAGLWKGE